MKYQVSPIIQFTNRTAELQLLIVDSWKGKTSDNNYILFLDEFIPMFAIKSGFSNILINIEPSSQIINQVFYDRMYPLTLEGLDNAMKELRRKK